MTFKELLQSYTWPSLSTVFLDIYPDAAEMMDAYKTVFENLQIIEPEDIDMSIDITSEIDDESYVEVLGIYNNPKNEEEHYSQAIEFTPWRNWLAMDISKESLELFSEEEIIVHSLYEMTFVAFSEEEIQKVLGKSEKSRADKESLTANERYVSATSIEDLLKDGGEEDEDEDED